MAFLGVLQAKTIAHIFAYPLARERLSTPYHSKSQEDAAEYPFACHHCGSSMGLDWLGYSQRKRCFQTVRPQCLGCADKVWKTRKKLSVEQKLEQKTFDDAEMPSHRPLDYVHSGRDAVLRMLLCACAGLPFSRFDAAMNPLGSCAGGQAKREV